ncbi:NlpC/P60 family protein [Palleronia sp.]|uniref:NlpC/P60 family protein n=1 Tax=Palleronia sp. TaxID=1940284 RepID=UPI0035C78C5A
MTARYEHLLGRPFIYGRQDCYSIVRDFFADNHNLVLPNYARPNEFWKHGMDMYRDRYVKNGFEVLHCHPSEYQEGDVFLMAITSQVANHAAVLVEGGKVLHHMWGRLSAVEPYRDLYRNTTVAVLRHRDVVVEKSESQTDIREYLSTRLKQKLGGLPETS